MAGFSAAQPSPRPAEMKNPRIQKTMQLLEVAQGQLQAGLQQPQPAIHDELKQAASHVDGALRDLEAALKSAGTRRTIAQGACASTDHPIEAASDTLRQANEELTKGLTAEQIQGGVKTATENIRLALKETEELARRTANMGPAIAPAPAPAAVPTQG